MDTLFDIIHVVLAVFIVGPMAILPMTAMRAVRAGEGRQVGSLAKSTAIFSWLSILVVIIGFGLIGMSDYGTSVTDGWIMTSLIAWLIAILLNLIIVVPSMNKAARALQPAGEAGSGGSAETKSYPQIAAFSGISTLLLLLVVVMMVWKP